MVISDAQLDRFTEQYQVEFGITLERTEALESFRSLIYFVDIMYSQDKQTLIKSNNSVIIERLHTKRE